MRHSSLLATVAAVSLVTLATAACQRDVGASRADTTRAAAGDTSGVAAGPLTDRGVVTLLSQVNGAEIGAAQGALPRIGDPTVRAYAQKMLRDHAALDSAVKALPVNETPAPFPPAQFITMQAASKHLGAVLGTMAAGPALDRAYMASQVADHAQAMDSLQHWRGAVRDQALRTALEGAMAKVQEHLNDARAIHAALGGGVDSGGSPMPVPRLTPSEINQAAGSLDKRPPDTTVTPTAHRVRTDTVRRDSVPRRP
jgi:putative membrane protein